VMASDGDAHRCRLRQRYGCPVFADVSPEGCREVEAMPAHQIPTLTAQPS
jgi:hypothetical protein